MATSAPPSYVTQLDPNLNTQLLTAQQQLALAQALRGQSMQPLQAPSGQNGRISPLSVLAQGLMAYTSGKGMDAATKSLGDVQSKVAQFQAQDQQDWLRHAGRYADQPQQAQPPQPQPQDQPPQPDQPAAPQGQQSAPGAPQPTFPAMTGQALARALMGSGDPQAGAATGQQPAPQQAGGSTVLNPMSAMNAMMANILRGGGDAPDAPPPASAPGASVPATNGQGEAAPGQLGTGPSAAGVVTKPPASSPSPSASAFARILGQNTGAAGGMPDPMSDPSIRYLSMGASRGYVPDGVADKAVDNFYRMNDNRTDVTKRLLSNGVQPGSPEWKKALDDMQYHDSYVAPVTVDQGKVVLNARTGAPFMQTPKMGEGMIGDYADPMNPTARPAGGYAEGRSQIVAAEERAKQGEQIRDVEVKGGRRVPMRAGVAALVGEAQGGIGGDVPKWTGGTLAPQELAQWKAAADRGDPQAKQVIASYYQAKQPLGQSQDDKLLTEQGSQVYSKITAENANNALHRNALNEMYGLAQHGKFGPGAEGMARVKALASNLGIDLKGAQTDQDVMKKFTYFIAMSQAGQGGPNTNQGLDGILSQVPNSGMTNEAIMKVVPQLVSQIDAKEARGKVASNFLNNGGPMSQLQDHLSKYNAIADPGTVSLGRRMHEASANGTGAQLYNEIQAKYGKAWPGVKARIQQLEQMGAF